MASTFHTRVNGHGGNGFKKHSGLYVLEHRTDSASGYDHWKAVFEFFLALVLLILLGPLIVLLMGLVRATSRGPALFRQQRMGRGGHVYTMYKLRSMRVDAEARTGAVWAEECDPRCTRLGRWLRALHLDELPQLANVVKGEMSLVGPRPERPEFIDVLHATIPGYLERLHVRPGITGLAQILLPPDHDIDDVHKKTLVDLHYIRHRGFELDLKLLVFTALRLLRFPVAWCSWLVQLPSVQSIPGLVAALRGEPAGRPFDGREPLAARDGVAAGVAFRLRARQEISDLLLPPAATPQDGTPAPDSSATAF